MRKSVALLCLLLCVSCSQYGQLNLLGQLPRRLNECSGMITFDGNTVWVIEDGSNPDAIREVDTLGQLVRSFEVSGGKNRDWEAFTRDTLGNVYIGDFGNNSNDRKDLRIYRLPDPRTEKGDKIPAEEIRFTYPDQKEFPPPKNNKFFDAEALIHRDGFLYIITKNRAEPFNGKATVYRVPDLPGTYTAERVTALEICPDARRCQVTDAALSPDGQRLVLLGYGYLWVYEDFGAAGFKGAPPRMISLQSNTQLEGVCFANDSLLYLTDEKSLGRGGYLYSYPLPLPKM